LSNHCFSFYQTHTKLCGYGFPVSLCSHLRVLILCKWSLFLHKTLFFNSDQIDIVDGTSRLLCVVYPFHLHFLFCCVNYCQLTTSLYVFDHHSRLALCLNLPCQFITDQLTAIEARVMTITELHSVYLCLL
jgi:hypothetical protein